MTVLSQLIMDLVVHHNDNSSTCTPNSLILIGSKMLLGVLTVMYFELYFNWASRNFKAFFGVPETDTVAGSEFY